MNEYAEDTRKWDPVAAEPIRETMSGSVQAELDDLAKALDYSHELAHQLRSMISPVLFDGDTAIDPSGPEDEPHCHLAGRVRDRRHQAMSANVVLRDMIERLRLS